MELYIFFHGARMNVVVHGIRFVSLRVLNNLLHNPIVEVYHR
jgi:hypothetical protein